MFIDGEDTGATNPLKDAGNTMQNMAQDLIDKFMTNFRLSDITATIDDMEKGAMDVAKQFGIGREQVVELQRSMGDAIVDVKMLGGNYQDIVNIQKTVGEQLGRNVIVQSEAFEGILATNKVLGTTTESLVKNFKDVGFSLYSITGQMEKVVQVAQTQGVSAQAVSKQVMANMDALNKFGFEKGVEGLAKMAAQAVSLRIDMNRSLAIAENLFDPDKAIEMASGLQRLGVAQSDLLDPLRLMDLAQNDPAELQNQLAQMSQQFVRLNEQGRFEILPGARRHLREVEKTLGMMPGELAKMALGSAELQDKLMKIRFPDFMSEDQQKMVANLAEMKDGEYVINVGGEEMKLQEALAQVSSKEELDKLIKAAEPKTMEELARDQLTVSEKILAVQEAIANRSGVAIAQMDTTEKLKQIVSGGYETLAKGFDVKGFKPEGISQALEGGLQSISQKIKAGENPMEILLESSISIADYFDTTFKESTENVNESFNKLKNSADDLILFLLGEEKQIGGAQKMKAKDAIIEFLPEDTLRVEGGKIFGGTQLGENTTTGGNTTSEQKITFEPMTITLNVNANGIDPEVVERALNTADLSQKVVEAFYKGLNLNVNPNQMGMLLKNQAMGTISSR